MLNGTRTLPDIADTFTFTLSIDTRLNLIAHDTSDRRSRPLPAPAKMPSSARHQSAVLRQSPLDDPAKLLRAKIPLRYASSASPRGCGRIPVLKAASSRSRIVAADAIIRAASGHKNSEFVDSHVPIVAETGPGESGVYGPHSRAELSPSSQISSHHPCDIPAHWHSPAIVDDTHGPADDVCCDESRFTPTCKDLPTCEPEICMRGRISDALVASDTTTTSAVVTRASLHGISANVASDDITQLEHR